MINHLYSKLNPTANSLELKTSLALQLYLLDIKEHLLDVLAELTPSQEVSLSDKIRKIEKYVKSRG